MDQEIIDYIMAAQQHGLTDYEIKQNLLDAGWEAAKVEANFAFARAEFGKFQDKKNSLSGRTAAVNPLFEQAPDAVMQNTRQYPGAKAELNENYIEAGHLKFSFGRKTFVILAIIFMLAVGTGAAYYLFLRPTPEKILSKFLLANAVQTQKKINFNVSYNDNDYLAPGAASTGITLTLSGQGYLDPTDSENPKTDAALNIQGEIGSEKTSTDLGFKILNGILYLDISNAERLKTQFGLDNVDWLKFDSANIAQSSDGSSTSATGLCLKNKLSEIWQINKLIAPGEFLAKEKLNNISVYHLKPQVQTANFIQAVQDTLELYNDCQENQTNKFTEAQQQNLLVLAKKIAILNFEVWIGTKDSRLYQIAMKEKIPSIKDFSLLSPDDYIPGLPAAKTANRDATRFVEVNQIASALDKYKNDNGGYPASQNGLPVNFGKYLSQFPEAPLPSDGTCTDYYNTYWYEAKGQAVKKNGKLVYPDFDLTFCLGSKTSNLEAGIGEFTSQGVAGNITCPTDEQKCLAEQSAGGKINSSLEQAGFTGTLNISLSFSNYGLTREVAEPENSLDIWKSYFGKNQTESQNNSSSTQGVKVQ